jgi:hypothetical protein
MYNDCKKRVLLIRPHCICSGVVEIQLHWKHDPVHQFTHPESRGGNKTVRLGSAQVSQGRAPALHLHVFETLQVQDEARRGLPYQHAFLRFLQAAAVVT